MGVLAGVDNALDNIDDTVMVIVPDGLDRLNTISVGDAKTLNTYLVALKGQDLEVTSLAADCRDGLLPCSFTGTYIGLTESTGDFADIGTVFEFEAGKYHEHIALPFGWLISVRAA